MFTFFIIILFIYLKFTRYTENFKQNKGKSLSLKKTLSYK